MNSAHTVILERTDTRKLSGGGRGHVGFLNGRKHIVRLFLADHQGVTETGRAGTERREPQDEPARSQPAHRQTAGAKDDTTDHRRTTTKSPEATPAGGNIGAQRPAPFPTGRAGGWVDIRPLEPHPGPRHEPPTHEDIKKAPGDCSSGGSKGRRLPTLPPLLGQYHRHKCV